MSTPSRNTLARAVLAAVITVACFAGGAILVPTPALAQATRDRGAEQFVQTEGQRIVSILADKSRSKAERVRAFRDVVDEIADVPRITRFVLGKYARTITPEQMQRFAPLFRQYEQEVYQQRLGDFHGDTLTVNGSIVRVPGDVIVNTTISGGQLSQPEHVAWRVLGSGANWKVVDVEAASIWLAITQQQDFVSAIDNHGGDIDTLIAQLQRQTQALTTAGEH